MLIKFQQQIVGSLNMLNILHYLDWTLKRYFFCIIAYYEPLMDRAGRMPFFLNVNFNYFMLCIARGLGSFVL